MMAPILQMVEVPISQFDSEMQSTSQNHHYKLHILQELFHHICAFIHEMEQTNPIPTHPKLVDQWEEEIRDFWLTSCDGEPTTKEQQVFDAVIRFRREVHTAACAASAVAASNTTHSADWQWLLIADQQEQRTEQWLKEKIDLLTASEISAIWSGPGSRARLIRSKVPGADGPSFYTQRLAIRRTEGNAMDWGIRYEPVVKSILESSLTITITDLGRIRHRTIERLAASPDGLITAGPPELAGRLVEIKCPPSRTITEAIPFDYWCQMQIQMEVCDLPACEYVECKFVEGEDKITDENTAKGWISLLMNVETSNLQYAYHNEQTDGPSDTDELVVIESYPWQLAQIRRISGMRDHAWFASIQNDLQSFWNDVEAAREGTWIPPPPRIKRVKEVVCAIVDDIQTSDP
jgi:hypothetical protein